mgnify:CR=1 FL=1
MKVGLQKFRNALGEAEIQVLQNCLQQAKQALPEDAMPWYLGSAYTPTGYLTPDHANIILSLRQDWQRVPHGLVWDAPNHTHASRSDALAVLAAELRELGHITGWRNEKFSYWPDSEILVNGVCVEPTDALRAAFEMERAAYRFFGLRSHAVHVNGFTEAGEMWCGRRSMAKPTDPGMLDNIAAGGLPVGEFLQSCSVREMAEEAGLSEDLAMTAWAVSMREFPSIAPKHRLSYFIGLALPCWLISPLGTVLGYFVAGWVPPAVTLGLVFINPLFFLLTFTEVKPWVNRIAIGLGCIFGPMFYVWDADSSLLLTGVVAGSLAYGVDRRWLRARPVEVKP